MRVLFLIVFLPAIWGCKSQKEIKNNKTNFIVVFTDDQGYQDLGCYGSPLIKTPNIDKMTNQGMRFTNFYVASSVCSASRAGLLTGKLPKNNGVGSVFWPDEYGMDSTNFTIAELLKQNGYQTACFGKWHLGDQKGSLPTHQGFNKYFGVPYSNDMCIGTTHKFAKNVKFNQSYTLEKAKADQQLVLSDREMGKMPWEFGKRNMVPIFNNDKIVEYPADQTTLTKRYFEKTIDFINEVKNKPFFVYLAPAMPHVPLFASNEFNGKSERGLYGDVVEEIDFYMGELLSFLHESGLDENTLVIFASDNGPWLDMGAEGGSAYPLRDGKFSNYEGGVRVPGIFWCPGKIKNKSINNSLVSTLDILPTIAELSNSDISDLHIDGKSIVNILSHDINKEKVHLYSSGKEVFGIRFGDWKYLSHSGKKWAKKGDAAELFNLKNDVGESINLIDSHPVKVKELQDILNKELKNR